jgi:hypothetical protein
MLRRKSLGDCGRSERLSEGSDGPGAAAGSDGNRVQAPENTAGPDSVPAGTEGVPAGAESASGRPVPMPRAGKQPPQAADTTEHLDTMGTADPADTTGTAERADATGGAAPADDERAELERLRAENRDLRTEREEQAERTAAKRRGRWRAPVSTLLIVFGCVLAPVSVLGVWAANQVSDTNRYVANMAPLISQPPIQHALSAKITQQITSRLDLPAVTSQAASQLQAQHLTRLANLVRTFSGQIVSGINGAISTAVSRIVQSPAMAVVWVQVNRAAHAGIVRVLSGQGGGAVDVVNNQVVINIGPLITQAKKQLSAQGLTVVNNLPTVNATFPLFEAPNLAKAQQGYRLLLTLKWVLPVLTLLLLGFGVYVARRHRRALIGAALGLAASMLVLGIALTIARNIYLNSVPPTVLPSDAAGAAYDTLIRFIREGLRALFVLGLVVAAGAFLTGPSVTAVRTRRAVVDGIDWVRTRGEQAGVRTGPVGEWTGAHKTLLRASAVALVAVIFVFVGHPTVGLVILLVVVLLVLLGLIELIGGRSPARAAAPQ